MRVAVIRGVVLGVALIVAGAVARSAHAQARAAGGDAREGGEASDGPRVQVNVTVEQDAPESSCLTAYGQTACGFDCRAAYGTVRCATTPYGRCHAERGTLSCWDPPPNTVIEAPVDGGRASAECVTHDGQTTCGYGCVRAYGRTRCADRPGARCVAASGVIKCGFACVEANGRVECAETSQGTCTARNGRIVCWDPPEALLLERHRRAGYAPYVVPYGWPRWYVPPTRRRRPAPVR